MSAISDSTTRASDGASSPTGEVERFVERHRRTIEVFTRAGWLAKGAVYMLFGVTAVAIAQQSAPDDEASPQGALGQIMDVPAGRALMAVMAVGLLLYALWRAASVILVDGEDAHAWGDRIGYSFSAVFYAVLGVTAAGSAWVGREPGDSNTVESVSQTLLENDLGRWSLALGGLITIAVGAYFAFSKGVTRGFAEDVRGVTEGGGDGMDRAIWIGGIVGWIGRGVVTMMVGWFVLRAAITFDPDEARGFDRALRESATTTTGTILVWAAAVGLISYGAFCLATHRRRTVADPS
jgi:hypothetical protein